jgi:hypothetical protein
LLGALAGGLPMARVGAESAVTCCAWSGHGGVDAGDVPGELDHSRDRGRVAEDEHRVDLVARLEPGTQLVGVIE